MFNTDMYQQGRGIQSGLRMGQGIGDAVNGTAAQTAASEALAKIKGGADKNMVIAELQKTNPEAAKMVMQLLGMEQPQAAGSIFSAPQRF